MANTSIEWTGKTWNSLPGCNDESAGCLNCYAKRQAYRLEHAFGMPQYQGTTRKTAHGLIVWTGQVNEALGALRDPLTWRTPCKVFVNSMGDTFHVGHTDERIDRVFAVILACHLLGRGHAFQVLTKRAARMREYFASGPEELVGRWMAAIHQLGIDVPASLRLEDVFPLPNVWLGVSVENQACASARIPQLMATPAATRFLSCEPLLAELDLNAPITCPDCHGDHGHDEPAYAYGDRVIEQFVPCAICDGTGAVPMLHGIDWVIVGGESGPRARPFHLEWAQRIVRDCRAANVAVFVKQLGANTIAEGDLIVALLDRKGGDIDEFPADLRVREFPTTGGAR